MIEIAHLTKKYGKHVAVDDVSLTVEPGKIYGFLGPNGAGKSTTMNIITGYLGATSGEVTINGFDILKQPEEARKCIGYLPELPPLYPDMTVIEYLKFVAELKKISKPEREKNITEALQMTGIEEIQGRLIRNLSKGYKQRVGLAQAILGFPPVIILDEPTVGLDPKQMIEMRELIKKLGENHTVILSSHILSEISAVCDHIFIISKGKLVASDTTKHLESKLQGGMECVLEVKGTTLEVEEALAFVQHIQNLSVEEKEQNICKVIIEAEQESDIREELFFTFANAKLPIYSMSTSGKSLEDVFLQLTKEEEVCNVGNL
ncbi:MAG: ABC transporter ATP-binding protein [Lachnospiraceae bacterium]